MIQTSQALKLSEVFFVRSNEFFLENKTNNSLLNSNKEFAFYIHLKCEIQQDK